VGVCGNVLDGLGVTDGSGMEVIVSVTAIVAEGVAETGRGVTVAVANREPGSTVAEVSREHASAGAANTHNSTARA